VLLAVGEVGKQGLQRCKHDVRLLLSWRQA
jgi:hypothetical protein